MTHTNPVVARIRALQDEERAWRARYPELALRAAVLDLVTSCGYQYYVEHYLGDDVALLETALGLLDAPNQRLVGSGFEAACLDGLRALDSATASLRHRLGNPEAEDALRKQLVDAPSRALLGRVDQEAAPDMVCWNETNSLLEEISEPYRCAARVSALAFFGAPDRYRVIDRMVAMRERYEARPSERTELDAAIIDGAREYVGWFGRSVPADRR